MYSQMHEKSAPIKIPSPSNFNAPEYGLKQNFFDPTKGSPPNVFMLKLQNRIVNLSPNYQMFHKNVAKRDSA
jgi:hypothetical protein